MSICHGFFYQSSPYGPRFATFTPSLFAPLSRWCHVLYVRHLFFRQRNFLQLFETVVRASVAEELRSPPPAESNSKDSNASNASNASGRPEGKQQPPRPAVTFDVKRNSFESDADESIKEHPSEAKVGPGDNSALHG